MTFPTPARQSHALRPLVLAAAVVAVLAGCNRDRDRPAAPPAPAPAAPAVVTPADAGAPFTFDSKTPFAEVSLVLPQAIKTQPDLHARLYAAGVRDLRQFTEGAQADRTEAGGDMGLGAYNKTIEITPGGETGKLFSLIRMDSEFTGGVHPNSAYESVLWDKALKREVTATDLFARGPDLAVLDRALCAAINAEKRRRDPPGEPISFTSQTWKCPKAADTPLVLAQGTTPGKAGGLVFLISAYLVGPYSEGPYEVTVPQSVFRALLAPAYADEFAGQPKPEA